MRECIQTSRRFFLRGLGASSAASLFSGCRLFESRPVKREVTGEVRLKFGVVSDVHLHNATDNLLEHGVDIFGFRHALEWYRDQGVDAVIIAGDMADNGLCVQLERVAKVWNEVFPNNKAPDGHTVEKLFVTGNHDWEGVTYGLDLNKLYPDPKVREKQVISNDLPGNWERIFGEPFKPVYVKEIKGYTFIGAHWCRERSLGGVADPTEVIAKVGPTIDPRKPFFFFQHPQPKGTCYGAKCWGQDRGLSTQALSAFPNAVAFSGHSHYSLTDERTIWQGAFTSINTSSLRYTDFPPSLDEYGFENAGSVAPEINRERVAEPCPWQWVAQQGMLVKVYDDAMVIVRREFRWNESLGDDWVMPLQFDGSNPMSEENRQEEELPPRYPEGAQAKLLSCERVNRAGEKVPCWEVRVPQANVEKATRPLMYEMKIVLEDGTVYGTRRLLTPGYNLPPETVDCYCPISFPLAKRQLPQDQAFHFEITPVSSLGTRGKSLVTEVVGG